MLENSFGRSSLQGAERFRETLDLISDDLNLQQRVVCIQTRTDLEDAFRTKVMFSKHPVADPKQRYSMLITRKIPLLTCALPLAGLEPRRLPRVSLIPRIKCKLSGFSSIEELDALMEDCSYFMLDSLKLSMQTSAALSDIKAACDKHAAAAFRSLQLCLGLPVMEGLGLTVRQESGARLYDTFITKDALRDEIALESHSTEPWRSAYVALGSNEGDRLEMIESACTILQRRPDIRLVSTSALYETDPMYVQEQGRYLNGVCKVRGCHAPPRLERQLTNFRSRLRARQWSFSTCSREWKNSSSESNSSTKARVQLISTSSISAWPKSRLSD